MRIQLCTGPCTGPPLDLACLPPPPDPTRCCRPPSPSPPPTHPTHPLGASQVTLVGKIVSVVDAAVRYRMVLSDGTGQAEVLVWLSGDNEMVSRGCVCG